MLLNAPYPADIRVKKETNALMANGYEIFLLCLRKKNQSYIEEIDGINIIRIDAGKNNYSLAFWDVIMSLSFVHPKFKKAIKKLLAREKIDFIHVHDLPLAGTAISLKNRFNIKVVLDLHENYPEALRTWFSWKKNPIVRLKNYLFMNPKRWTEHEKEACKNADQLIAVVNEMKARIIASYEINPSKIKVVTNTEDKKFIAQELDNDVYQKISKSFILTYSGGIGPHRGVDTAIKGMARLIHHPIHLVIVGFGSDSVMNSLYSLVNDCQLANVHFEGFQPFSKFYSYMHLADVNIIPHQSNGHTDNTVPHKLFQGMMTGKPLLVSSCAPLKRFVEEYNCGLVFKADDEKDFAAKVEELFHNNSLRSELGENGYKATIEGDLNWETTQKELITLYEKLKN